MNTDYCPRWMASRIASIDALWLPVFLASAKDRHENAAKAMSVDPKSAESAFRQMVRQELAPKATLLGDGVAIVPMQGPIAHAPDVWDMMFDGVEDSRSILSMVNSVANNSDVKGVLLDINSPGGMVTGGTDIADAVKAMAKKKPVVAWSGGMMASLAYQIGSQATEVITSASASVGSIGTIITFADVSKALEQMGVKMEVITNKEAEFKGITQGVALSESQRGYLQDRAQKAFDEFASMVTAKRPNVKDSSMRGQVFWGKEAKSAGLVDRIGDQGFALGILRQMAR